MKFKSLKETRTGYCVWQYPVMKDYQLACCDCGLVHTVQLEVIEQTTKEKPKVGFHWRKTKNKNLRIRLRANRNVRETERLRKRENISMEITTAAARRRKKK